MSVLYTEVRTEALHKLCGRDREDLNFWLFQVTGEYVYACCSFCWSTEIMGFSCFHVACGVCSGDLQIGTPESCFGRTLCSTSISKNMRSGDNISVSAINYKGWHIYIIIVEIPIKLKHIKHAFLYISFSASSVCQELLAYILPSKEEQS